MSNQILMRSGEIITDCELLVIQSTDVNTIIQINTQIPRPQLGPFITLSMFTAMLKGHIRSLDLQKPDIVNNGFIMDAYYRKDTINFAFTKEDVEKIHDNNYVFLHDTFISILEKLDIQGEID